MSQSVFETRVTRERGDRNDAAPTTLHGDSGASERVVPHGSVAQADASVAGMTLLRDVLQPYIAAGSVRMGRVWELALRRPRALQILVALLGSAIVFWSQFHDGAVSRGTLSLPSPFAPPAALAQMPLPPSGAGPLEVVAAYNAASITAGMLGRADPMEPFLVADGAASDAVAHEFRRRAEQHEIHHPILVRWGVVHQSADATRASVQTQEVWDDTTLVRGMLTDARRGIVQRVRYNLRRANASQPWQIETIESQTILP